MSGRRISGALLTAATALALPACQSSYQWFRPRVGVTGEAPDGTPAGEYDLWWNGARLGELRLWSVGGEPRGDGTSLHVGVEVENLGGSPLVLDADVRVVDLATGPDGTVPTLVPSHAHGPTRAEPLDRARRELWFDVAGASPWTIEAFTVVWRIRIADGDVLTGQTPFQPDLYARLRNAIELAMDDGGNGD